MILFIAIFSMLSIIIFRDHFITEFTKNHLKFTLIQMVLKIFFQYFFITFCILTLNFLEFAQISMNEHILIVVHSLASVFLVFT